MEIKIRYRHLDTGQDAEALMVLSEDLNDAERGGALECGLEKMIENLFDAKCTVTVNFDV